MNDNLVTRPGKMAVSRFRTVVPVAFAAAGGIGFVLGWLRLDPPLAGLALRAAWPVFADFRLTGLEVVLASSLGVTSAAVCVASNLAAPNTGRLWRRCFYITLAVSCFVIAALAQAVGEGLKVGYSLAYLVLAPDVDGPLVSAALLYLVLLRVRAQAERNATDVGNQPSPHRVS